MYEWVEGTTMQPLLTPDNLLSNNDMLEGKKIGFKEEFKGRKMKVHSISRQTPNLHLGQRAEGAK